MLRPCVVCPRECRVDRPAGQTGCCGTADRALVASFGPHFGEERELVGGGGSGTIFFAGCNLACLFCQNYELSQARAGRPVDPPALAGVMLGLQAAGCANVNLVSPSHVVPMVLEALAIAAARGLRLPLVYNSGGYDSLAALRLLHGVVDIYMPDLKYGDSAVGLELCGAPDYPARSRAAVLEMHRQVGELEVVGGVARRGLLVRHLVLPGGLAGTAGVADFVAREVSPQTAFNLMAQYRPSYRAAGRPPLDRGLTAEEWLEARAAVRRAGLVPLEDR